MGDDCLWGFELGPDCSSTVVATAGKWKPGKDLALAPGLESVGVVAEAKGKKDVTDNTADNMLALRKKRMMAAGQAPGKQLFMTGFMLWMSGTGINIFSIMMTGMAVWNPVKSLLSLNKVFEQFKGMDGLLQAKLMFILLNGVGLTFGMYKLALMGLLPLQSSDWISLLQTRVPQEFVGTF